MILHFTSSDVFHEKLSEAVEGMGKVGTKCEIERISYKYKVESAEGGEWATKLVEDDADVMAIVYQRHLVYVDVRVPSSATTDCGVKVRTPTASSTMRCSRARASRPHKCAAPSKKTCASA
jgi:hypothetical protein